jgi:hypothetical protein
MKINREKVMALLALLLTVLGLSEAARSFIAPTRGIEVVPYIIRRGGREILRRSYRRFSEDGEPGRNPFSFSEGWERLDSIPMGPPPVPAGARLVPLLSFGPSPLDAGFIFERPAPPAEETKDGKEPGE